MLLKLLAGAVSALGLAGFVAVLGGAVVWVRLHSVELPADQAVAVIPNSQLVVTGAAPLVFFLVLGAIAVVGVYVAEPRGVASTRSASAIVVLVGLELGYALVSGGFRLGGTLAVLAVIALNSAAAVWLLKRWRKACRERERALDPGRNYAAELEPVRREIRARQRDLAILGAWNVLLGALLWWITPWLGYTLLAATLFGIIVLGIAYGTQGFLPYGCALFLSVALFGATEKSLQSVFGTPMVQPAAAFVAGKPMGVSGLYVAEASDRLYLAHVRPCQDRWPSGVRGVLARALLKEPQWHASPGTGVLFWIPEGSVTALNIGPVQKLDDAMWARKRMRLLLIAEINGGQAGLPPARTRRHPAC